MNIAPLILIPLIAWGSTSRAGELQNQSNELFVAAEDISIVPNEGTVQILETSDMFCILTIEPKPFIRTIKKDSFLEVVDVEATSKPAPLEAMNESEIALRIYSRMGQTAGDQARQILLDDSLTREQKIQRINSRLGVDLKSELSIGDQYSQRFQLRTKLTKSPINVECRSASEFTWDEILLTLFNSSKLKPVSTL